MRYIKHLNTGHYTATAIVSILKKKGISQSPKKSNKSETWVRASTRWSTTISGSFRFQGPTWQIMLVKFHPSQLIQLILSKLGKLKRLGFVCHSRYSGCSPEWVTIVISELFFVLFEITKGCHWYLPISPCPQREYLHKMFNKELCKGKVLAI